MIARRAREDDSPARLIHDSRRRRGRGVTDIHRQGNGVGAVDDIEGRAEAGRVADVDLPAQGGPDTCTRENQSPFAHDRGARVRIQALEFPSAWSRLVDSSGATAIANDAGDAISGMRAAQDQGGSRGPTIIPDQQAGRGRIECIGVGASSADERQAEGIVVGAGHV